MTKTKQFWKHLLTATAALMLVVMLTGRARAVTGYDWESAWKRYGEKETGLTMFDVTVNLPTADYPGWHPSGRTTFEQTLFGLKDSAGTIVLPAEYTNLEYKGEYFLTAVKYTEKKLASTNKYDYISGLIKTDGTIVIPYGYGREFQATEDNTWVVYEEYSGVKYKACALYDNAGVELLPFGMYDGIHFNGYRDSSNTYYDGKSGCYHVSKGGLCGMYRIGVGEIIPCEYADLYYVVDDMVVVKNKSGYYGVRDISNRELIPCKYSSVFYLGENMFEAKNSANKAGVLDNGNNLVRPFEYRDFSLYSQGCFVFKTQEEIGGWGVMDRNGNILVPCQYDRIEIDAKGNGKAGMWNGKYSSYWGGGGSDDMVGVGKIYDYSYYFKASDLLAGTAPTTPPVSESKPSSDSSPTSMPTQYTPIAGEVKVSPTTQKLTVNGAEQKTEIYNINGANYFKLRDVAALMNGTASQFSVDFDGATNTVVVRTGAAYTPAGGELAIGSDKSATTVKSAQKLQIDGKAADLPAYNIGGNNFFGLRDLGAALGFDVDYDSITATMIVKSRS